MGLSTDFFSISLSYTEMYWQIMTNMNAETKVRSLNAIFTSIVEIITSIIILVIFDIIGTTTTTTEV